MTARLWLCAALVLLLLAPAMPALAQIGCDGSGLPPGPYSGNDGPYPVVMTQLADQDYPDQPILVFQPQGATGKRPVIFFAHGYGPNHWQAYADLIRHVVSLGNILVYAPYPMGVAGNAIRYEVLWSGFTTAADRFADEMDLTRVGFVGHSFGGGATPVLAYQGLVVNGWGKNGALMLLLAPWYAFETPDIRLQHLPANLVQVAEIYDQDTTNDHRMAIDLYQHLAPQAGQYFFLGQSGTLDGCAMVADHSTPGSNPSLLLKRLVVFRVFDAASALAFDQAPDAAAALSSMGAPGANGSYQPLVSVASPTPDAPQSTYK